MKKNTFDKIGDYYNALVSKYGHDPRSCDYGRSESQKVKFEVLSSCIDFANKSVLDIGCGFADFYGFLSKKYHGINYSGVDLSHEMIKNAKQIHPNISLEVKNVFETGMGSKYDIVTANGIFYLLGENALDLMSDFISKMFNMSNSVVAFNSLSSWANDKEKGEFYADPLEVLKFCKTLSPWVVLRHDYHSRDFTIFIYKERNV